jgi:diguanylate cyclase (GGDEF)-like protein
MLIILLAIVYGLVRLMMRLANKLNKMMEEITYLSNVDPLTELFNRRFFNKQLIQEIERAERYDCPFALIFMDIDYFKAINDTYGHEIGDVILKAISALLVNNVRRVDIVSRWGGEEFIILCINTELDKAILLAEKLRSIIEKMDFETVEHMTCSFGVSSYHKMDDFAALLQRADEALYISKDKGRNRVTVEKLH